MQTERHVRLFRNGRNQAIRIPREFELEGNEAVIRKDGDRLIIEPVVKGGLLALLADWEATDEILAKIYSAPYQIELSTVRQSRYIPISIFHEPSNGDRNDQHCVYRIRHKTIERGTFSSSASPCSDEDGDASSKKPGPEA